MKKSMIHFKKKHPIRKAVHRFWIKWCLFWTKERINETIMFIASAMFLGFMLYMFIMYE